MTMSTDTADSITAEEFLLRHGPKQWYHNYPVWSDKDVLTAPNQGVRKMRGQDTLIYHGLSDVAGMNILDVGAFAGGFSFALEDMGATVTSLDVMDPYLTGYAPVHYLRQSTARYCQESIYSLNPEQFGTFDLIWFQGVLYHLKHPLLALERLNSVLDVGGLLVGSTCSSEGWPDSQPHPHAPNTGTDPYVDQHLGAALAYFKTKNLGSWFSPNAALVMNWLNISGFEVERIWCSRRNDLTPPVGWVHYYARKVRNPTPEYQAQVVYEGFTGEDRKARTNATPYTPFYCEKEHLNWSHHFDYNETIKLP